MGKREQINKRLEYSNPTRKHIFVCFMDNNDKDIMKLEKIMRRHHFLLDYSRLECSVDRALRHMEEYSKYNKHCVEKYWKQLLKKAIMKPEVIV